MISHTMSETEKQKSLTKDKKARKQANNNK